MLCIASSQVKDKKGRWSTVERPQASDAQPHHVPSAHHRASPSQSHTTNPVLTITSQPPLIAPLAGCLLHHSQPHPSQSQWPCLQAGVVKHVRVELARSNIYFPTEQELVDQLNWNGTICAVVHVTDTFQRGKGGLWPANSGHALWLQESDTYTYTAHLTTRPTNNIAARPTTPPLCTPW